MKTLAIRLDDDLHAQLSVIAQLGGTSITDEIRQAIEAHVTAKRTDPELTDRAEAVR
jgi:predicted transcriptional regulator